MAPHRGRDARGTGSGEAACRGAWSAARGPHVPSETAENDPMSLLPVGQTDVDRTVFARLTWRDWRPTLVAAGLSAGAVAILIIAFDSVSAYERPVALASLTTSILWIAAALMLTAVSLLDLLESRRLPPRVLVHLRLTLLGALSTIGLAVGALLVTTFPVDGGVDVKPPAWQVAAVFF